MKQHKRYVLTGSPGSGKTTLAKHLLSQTKFNLKFSISATTRQIRENETDGIDYHFMSLEDFKAKIGELECSPRFVIFAKGKM